MTAPTTGERRILKVMILLGLFSILNFLLFFFQPEHRGNPFLFSLLSVTILYSALKKLYMWYNYSNMSVPDEPKIQPRLEVDILTTYFPGEPYQMIVTTLEAITSITYPHNTYLCDEANDPFLKKFCDENGIIHVTREDKTDAKAGNINNALKKVARGDICVVLDPDHIPEPHFLDPILPHFANPEVGFVQVVQSYYNGGDSLVAQGAAEQTFQFYGPMMMTLNAYGTVNAIGANCVFRRSALDSIGGHAPGLCEDMHTAMLLYSRGWKAVYVPEVLAKGLAPSNLTNYFKQQLKWSKGTFDLLLEVYPQVFFKLTTRQKIHFGILPLHYFCGLIYFINFLIPILSLIFSTTPWKGNIITFGLALLPVAVSALLIRTFVQKWLIEKEERGFHLVGGLLQINTWWIYMLGLGYSIVNKKVPYLPTPKENEFSTNLKIVVPNAIVALLSIFAVIYGLRQDFTPFSLFMSGFALFNAAIMTFGIYLSVKVTNRNQILKNALQSKSIEVLLNTKNTLRKLFHYAFKFARKTALPLLIIIVVSTLAFKEQKDNEKWDEILFAEYVKKSGNYLGIFQPPRDDGTIDMEEINILEAKENIHFDIISFYLAWENQNVLNFPYDILENISENNAIPMITWEPWSSSLSQQDTIASLKDEKKVLKYIAEGYFDDYIIAFADHLAAYDKPVFLRFAHEFDNPFYPWSSSGGNTAPEFKEAWRHVHDVLHSRGAFQVMMVWNPWKTEGMEKFYPGDAYVDWIGKTALNYGPLTPNGEAYPFRNLYEPFHDRLQEFTNKPVMLAEFGSVKILTNQQEWIQEALLSIEEEFEEINAVVLFNSRYDNNIPENTWYKEKYIDWTTDSVGIFNEFSERNPALLKDLKIPKIDNDEQKLFISPHVIRGVTYKKGNDWRESYYVVTKQELLEDLEKMKDANINTIRFTGGGVYDYNILKYSRKNNMKVIFDFNLEPRSGFIGEEEKLDDLKEEILDEVRNLRDHKEIIAYNFSTDLQPFFEKPLLFSEKKTMLRWLQDLMIEIKTIDPSKSLVVEVPIDSQTLKEVERLNEILPVDSFGLAVKNEPDDLEQLVDILRSKKIDVFISSINGNYFAENSALRGMDVVIQNWQDERLSNRVSLDGLIDFEGRKKVVYEQIESIWDDADSEVSPLTVEILKPAVPLLAGMTAKYQALIFADNQWLAPEEFPHDLFFEWKLVKKDMYDNPLAIKELGTGHSIGVPIPADYENYELILTVLDPRVEYVIKQRSQLHTPLE